jgi:acetyl esterase/lipase
MIESAVAVQMLCHAEFSPTLRAKLRLTHSAAWLRMFRLLLQLAFLLCTAPAAAAQSASFSMHTESAQLDAEHVQVDVFRPSADALDGVAILAHGFARDRSRHRALGEELAAAGVIAVIPDLPHVVDHWRNGAALAELANKLEDGALGLPPVKRSRLVLIGTSAGGLATVLAAAKLPGIAGWIGLDPVDRTGSAVHAASQLTSPAVVLLAESSACNLFGSGRSIARALPWLLRSTKLPGASHCDFEGPTNKFCKVMCGGSSPRMQLRARQEAVHAAVEILRGPVDIGSTQAGFAPSSHLPDKAGEDR